MYYLAILIEDSDEMTLIGVYDSSEVAEIEANYVLEKQEHDECEALIIPLTKRLLKLPS